MVMLQSSTGKIYLLILKSATLITNTFLHHKKKTSEKENLHNYQSFVGKSTVKLLFW